MNCTQCEARLDAYVDGVCDAQELAAIDAHLLACSSCAHEALGRTQIKRATREAAHRFAPSPEFARRIEASNSRQLTPAAAAPRTRDRSWRIWIPSLAGAVFATLLFLVATVAWTRHSAEQQAVVELLDIHVATLASPNPVDVVSTDRHTVKPWFQGKLPFAFNLPELQGTPFQLEGGRLIYFRDRPGAQLLFQTGRHQISVFLVQQKPGEGFLAHPSSPRTTTENGFQVETWTGQGIQVTVLSDTTPSQVRALSDLLRAAAGRS